MMMASSDDLEDSSISNGENPFIDPLETREVNMTQEEFENKYYPKEADGFNLILKTTDPNKFKTVNFTEFTNFLSEQLYETSKDLQEGSSMNYSRNFATRLRGAWVDNKQ